MSAFQKELYDKTLEYGDRVLSLFSSKNTTKFYILCIIHYYVVFIFPILITILSPTWMSFLIVTIFHLMVFFLHHLYRGCIFLKMERKYMNSKEWYGFYHLLELIGITDYKDNITYYHRMAMGILFVVHMVMFGVMVKYKSIP